MKFARCLGSFICDSSPWDMKVAKAFCTIGNIYNQMGMLPEALAMYEKDLQITAHNLQPDDLRVADAKHNVGLASCKVGRYSEGLALMDEALDIRIATLGPQHADVANALICIGGHTEALERFQRATSIRKSAPGPNHAISVLFFRRSAATSGRASLGQTNFASKQFEVHAILPRNLGCEHHPFAESKQLADDNPPTRV